MDVTYINVIENPNFVQYLYLFILAKLMDKYFDGLDIADSCYNLGDLNDKWLNIEILRILQKADFKGNGSYSETLDCFLEYVMKLGLFS